MVAGHAQATTRGAPFAALRGPSPTVTSRKNVPPVIMTGGRYDA
jgi:hypothetical protein